MTNKPAASSYIPSFGRRRGRRISQEKEGLVTHLLPQIAITADQDIASAQSLFESPVEEIWLEIGFGTGENLATQVKNRPNIGFIGCEPFAKGVANFLGLLDGYQGNIKIWCDDSRLLIERLPVDFLTKVFILFPDPWPKLKHHKRRLVSPQTLQLLATKLRTGGQVTVATDHRDYARAILASFKAVPNFSCAYQQRHDLFVMPHDMIPTKYQERAIQRGLHPYFFRYQKI
jgi:tRNA (guanine-N7-)-methyltransferase